MKGEGDGKRSVIGSQEAAWLTPTVRALLEPIARDAFLTPTLKVRLTDIAEGLTYAEIAHKYDISINTVKTQTRNLLQSLGLSCRHEIEDAMKAAQVRSDDGATTQEVYTFLRLRFE